MCFLRVSSVGGLYHEFFNPNPNLLNEVLEVKNSRLDANGTFWSGFFKQTRIETIIDILKNNAHAKLWQRPQYHAILSDPQQFIERAVNAPLEICSPSCTPRRFFSCLETMTIVCQLYSDFETAPFQLSLEEGYCLDNCSSELLYQQSLHPATNPYLSFVNQIILPVVEKATPDILFLEGRLDHYLAAVALKTRMRFPDIHICLSRHDSEYYSLNKITTLLKQNQILFRMVDSVVLEYFEETENALINALNKGKGLQSVPNLIYQTSDGQISETKLDVPSNRTQSRIYYRDAKQIADVHLEPFSKCHWNQCTFCGINKKYHYEDSPSAGDSFHSKLLQIKQLSNIYPYLWFIDEALSPPKLRMLAQGILSNGIKVYWQARCRADNALLEDGLPKLLKQAGLRELRIGLESASYPILKLMHKFEDGFRLELMEAIIQEYTELGISVHCPMILGFPQETQGDRKKTYEFLSEMRKRYPLFTFNLNILCLDVSSPLFHQWTEYHIQEIHFPCSPKYFLGNWVSWMPASLEQELDSERQLFMREQLYPWLPPNALTPPTILYRLSETSRRTLPWKTTGMWDDEPIFSFSMELQIASSLTVSQEAEDLYLIYCWDSHHYMHGNHFLLELLEAFRKPKNVAAVIKSLVTRNPEVFRYDELPNLIFKMFSHGYLTGIYQPFSGTKCQRVKAAYNQMYTEGTYLYELSTERILIENQGFLSPGEALELGVGLGRNIPFLLGHGFHVTGIDISDVAIEKLREQYGTQGQFEVQDIQAFWIAPSRYTLIICSMVLSYLDDAELTVIAESIKQGLTPGGCLFIKDLSSEDPLAKIPEPRTVERRNFFTREKILRLFNGLTPVQVSLTLRHEPQRLGCGEYFDLVSYFGQKPFQ